MADIIPFKPPVRNGDAPRAGVAADIVIFPGVRYERPADAGSDEPSQSGEPTGRRGKRRKLS